MQSSVRLSNCKRQLLDADADADADADGDWSDITYGIWTLYIGCKSWENACCLLPVPAAAAALRLRLRLPLLLRLLLHPNVKRLNIKTNGSFITLA